MMNGPAMNKKERNKTHHLFLKAVTQRCNWDWIISAVENRSGGGAGSSAAL
jgi:hypothetical protein